MKDRKRRKRAWFLTLWLVGVLVLAEGSVRLAGFILRRDDSIRIGRESGRNVIHCIGDSFTYGTGVDPDQAYPKVLERMLQEAGDELVVENHGWPGLSSSNAVYAVAQILEKEDVALILVLTGWNANDTDFQRLAERKNRAVPWTSRLDTLLERSRLYRLTKQLATYRSRTAVLDGIELVPQAPEMELYDFRAYQEIALENLRSIAELDRRFDARLVFLNYPYRDLPDNPYSKNEYYHVVVGRTPLEEADYVVPDRRPDEIAIHAAIRHVGEREGIPVIDLHEAFVSSGRDDLFQDDWHHPTAAGHEIIARAIFDHLRD